MDLLVEISYECGLSMQVAITTGITLFGGIVSTIIFNIS